MSTKLVCDVAIMARALGPSASQITSIEFSVIPSLSFMSMRLSAMNAFPFFEGVGEVLYHLQSVLERPTSAPMAMAMGSPIIPVPGIPTPMAFLRMFAESSAVMCCGLQPSVSVARAVHSATAMGSVQPMAGHHFAVDEVDDLFAGLLVEHDVIGVCSKGMMLCVEASSCLLVPLSVFCCVWLLLLCCRRRSVKTGS